MPMSAPPKTRWIVPFDQGGRDMRDLLGGKGANVAEMTRVLGRERVPTGFTITTEACVRYMRDGRTEPEGLAEEVADALRALEERAGKRLGDAADPLLVSVRSGARESMPGMMDTVLNLGLNDRSVEGLAARTENPRFAWDAYRRVVQMFANVCRGIPSERLEAVIADRKAASGVAQDSELSTDDLRGLVDDFKAVYRGGDEGGVPERPGGAAPTRDPRRL
jgi:pyruvate, orthophosphate dikinase